MAKDLALLLACSVPGMRRRALDVAMNAHSKSILMGRLLGALNLKTLYRWAIIILS